VELEELELELELEKPEFESEFEFELKLDKFSDALSCATANEPRRKEEANNAGNT